VKQENAESVFLFQFILGNAEAMRFCPLTRSNDRARALLPATKIIRERQNAAFQESYLPSQCFSDSIGKFQYFN
jgi:hypothetical protein